MVKADMGCRAARIPEKFLRCLAVLCVARMVLTPAGAAVDAVLGRPTEQSVSVSLVADQPLEARVSWAPASGGPPAVGAILTLDTGNPAVFEITGLAPRTRHSYRIEHRQPGTAEFAAGETNYFQTRRAPGEPYTFVVQADLHFADASTCDPATYAATVANMRADNPDFLVDLGDTFMTEKFLPDPVTPEILDGWALSLRRDYLGAIGGAVPLFIASGNHDSELGWLIPADSPGQNRAVWSVRSREKFFPAPVPGTQPDGGFSGSGVPDPALSAPRDGFYAFNWGDALIIVLDPFWYTARKPAGGVIDPWGWTLGSIQYNWLREVLTGSRAPYIFVFIHHLVGGSLDGRGRGGVEFSSLFEWGGRNADGTDGFAARRPGWDKPIQDLLLAHGVQAVFHGHDHFFARQNLDADSDGRADLVYLECPQAASRIPDSDKVAAEYGYLACADDAAGRSGLLGGSGHVRVRVTQSRATLELVRSYAPQDRSASRVNGAVAYSFDVLPRTPQETPFPGSIILGRPTDSSVTASLLSPAQSGDVFVSWRSEAGDGSGQTQPVLLKAGEVMEINLSGLQPDRRHYYRVWFRPVGESAFVPAPERSFHTCRRPGSTFTFTIQGDSHPERQQQFDPGLYQRTLLTAATDQPDFHILMGDDFSVDTLDPLTVTREDVAGRYLLQRPWLGLIGDSAPLFLVNGNHEQAARYLLDGTPDNVAVWAQNARNAFYPQPAPDGFYTGNEEVVPFIGLLRNHFAWTWGDALFVVIDPYWSSPGCVDNPFGGGPKRDNLWEVEHGDAQYLWLKRTLESSNARHKFVFAHHVLGTGRGGIELAPYYEWGGYDRNGEWRFDTLRAGWPKSIHQLMADSGVTVFFQGHDHIWARQELDGVVYQTLPEPADPYYSLYNDGAYLSGDKYPNTGYTRVTVSPAGVNVEYVRTWLPQDEGLGRVSGSVACSYTAGQTITPWGVVTGGWRWSPLEWVYDSAFPYVYLASAQCYGWIPAGSTAENLFCYLFRDPGYWIYTGSAIPGWFYHYGGPRPGWNRWQPFPN